MKFFIIQSLLASLILLMLHGCQTITSRGQYVDDNSLSQLERKDLTKDQVENLIGTPTIIPDYTPNTWYYVERSLAQRAWFEPKVVEQRIVKIVFNNKDIVEEIMVINDSHKDDVNIINEYTEVFGTELNGVQKFVRNIGRFNKTTEGSKKKKKIAN